MTITQNNGTIYTRKEVLALLMAGKIDEKEADVLLDKISSKGNGQTSVLKATEKGCVQFRGIPGVSVQFGMSLYPKTLEWILEHGEEVKAFIEANRERLSFGKDDAKFAKPAAK